MYNIQRKKFFPLPEYDLSEQKVKVTIIGKVVDVNYARKMAEMPNLTLDEIILLDKVAKQKTLSDDEIKSLKIKHLIEGRKPNFHISSDVAAVTGDKTDYMKQRGIDDKYCQKMILDYLGKFGQGQRTDFENLLLDKLPDILDLQQKKNKIKNNLQALRKIGKITNIDNRRALHGRRHLRRPVQADCRPVDLSPGRPAGGKLAGATEGNRRADFLGAGLSRLIHKAKRALSGASRDTDRQAQPATLASETRAAGLLLSHLRTRSASPIREYLPVESRNTRISLRPAIWACITRQRPASLMKPVF